MSILLVCTLFLIGYLNTDNNSHKTYIAARSQNRAATPTISNVPGARPGFTANAGELTTSAAAAASRETADASALAVNNNRQSYNEIKAGNRITGIHRTATVIITAAQVAQTEINVAANTVAAPENGVEIFTAPAPGTQDQPETPVQKITTGPATSLMQPLAGSLPPANEPTGAPASNVTATISGAATDAAPDEIHTSSGNQSAELKPVAAGSDKSIVKPSVFTLSTSDKSWIEDFAMHHKPVAKKWAGKLSWTAYITPSVVYRNLRNNSPDKLVETNPDYNNADIDRVVKHKPSFGAETGIGLLYDVRKKIRLKAGIQLNYTRYNAMAYENHHPIASSILLNNINGDGVYESFQSSPYSNAGGLTPVKLHNQTYQVSIPFGLDVKLASLNENISWYAGAALQPTFIMFANSYLISSDRRSYVTDRSLLNRFNVNAGFETYLSIKTENYTWQVGPQFRSQIFTTNSKVYTVEERLMNFGFKVGISKRL